MNDFEKKLIEFLKQGIDPDYNVMAERIRASFNPSDAKKIRDEEIKKVAHDNHVSSQYGCFLEAFECVLLESEYNRRMQQDAKFSETKEEIEKLIQGKKQSFYLSTLAFLFIHDKDKFQECVENAKGVGVDQNAINIIMETINRKLNRNSYDKHQNEDENSLESRLVKVLKRGVGTDFNSTTEIMKNEFQPDEIKKLVETDTAFNDAALNEEYSCIHPVLLGLNAENEAKNNTNGSSIESDLYGDVWQEQSAMQSKMRMIDFYNNTLTHFIGAKDSDKIQECIENAKKDGLSEKQVNAILSKNGYDLDKHKQDETDAKLDDIISLVQGLKGKNATQEEIAKIIAESTKNLVGEKSDDKPSDGIKPDEPENIVKSTDDNQPQQQEQVDSKKNDSVELKDVKWDDIRNLSMSGVQQYFCERQFDNSYTIKKRVEGGVGQFIEYGKTPNGDIILLPSPSFYTGKKPLLDTGVSVFSLLFGKDGYDDAHQLDTIHPAVIKPLNGEKVSIKDALVAMGSAKTVSNDKDVTIIDDEKDTLKPSGPSVSHERDNNKTSDNVGPLKWDYINRLHLKGKKNYSCSSVAGNNFVIAECKDGELGQYVEYGRTKTGDIILIPNPLFYAGNQPIFKDRTAFSLLFGEGNYNPYQQIDTITPAVIADLNGSAFPIEFAVIKKGFTKTGVQKSPQTVGDRFGFDIENQSFKRNKTQFSKLFDPNANIEVNLEALFEKGGLPLKYSVMRSLLDQLNQLGVSDGKLLKIAKEYLRYAQENNYSLDSYKCIKTFAIMQACGKDESMYAKYALKYHLKRLIKAQNENDEVFFDKNYSTVKELACECVYTGCDINTIIAIFKQYNVKLDIYDYFSENPDVLDLLEKRELEKKNNSNNPINNIHNSTDDINTPVVAAPVDDLNTSPATPVIENGIGEFVPEDLASLAKKDGVDSAELDRILSIANEVKNSLHADKAFKGKFTASISPDPDFNDQIVENRPATPSEKIKFGERLKRATSMLFHGEDPQKSDGKGGK